MKRFISFSGGVESTTMCLLYGKGRYTKEEIDMLLPIVGKLVNGNDKKTYDKNPDGTKSWMQD